MRLPFSERHGILSGGNWIVDRVKIVDRYPEREHLSNILSESIHNGGAAFNLLTDLSLLGATFPLAGIGKVGEDADGAFILARCRALAIDAAWIRKISGVRTSFTDVVSEKQTGKRTFFHARGANAYLGPEDFPLELSRARIFHLGYLMLLDRLDQPGEDGHSQAYQVLTRARALGFKTAVDMVSSEDAAFAPTLRSTLPAIDILFLNEYEAEKATGIRLRNETSLESAALRAALEKLIAQGVGEWAIVHLPLGACALSVKGEWVCQGSVKVPPERILGTVGAGDAFAAGVLYGVHEELDMEECLMQGVCSAAACITRPGSSDGMVTLGECLHWGKQYGFRERAATEVT